MATDRYADLLKQGFMKPAASTSRVGFKTYRKIDLYWKRAGGTRDYLCSTNAARNLKEARERYAISTGGVYAASDLFACYAD